MIQMYPEEFVFWIMKNVIRTPTFAVDGHMILMDPWRGKKGVSPDGGVEVSMTCGGGGMGGACGT